MSDWDKANQGLPILPSNLSLIPPALLNKDKEVVFSPIANQSDFIQHVQNYCRDMPNIFNKPIHSNRQAVNLTHIKEERLSQINSKNLSLPLM